MRQYLCQFINVELENALNKVVRVIPENESNFVRGYIKAMKDILDIPKVIKNRMEAERTSNYKEIMRLSAESVKELN